MSNAVATWRNHKSSGPVSRALVQNFQMMADLSSRHNAVTIAGTNLWHFSNEVFSWHSINGVSGDDALPAILITNGRFGRTTRRSAGPFRLTSGRLGGGDQIKIWRLEQQAIKINLAHKRLKERGIATIQPVSPSIGIPLLESAALETRDELVDIWVGLLAAAMDPRKEKDVRLSYIRIVKAMDPLDALVFSRLTQGGVGNGRDVLIRELKRNSTEIDISFSNLIDLGCVRVFPVDRYKDGNFSTVHLTSLGIELKKVLEN